MLEGLVEEVYQAMSKEYLHRRDSRGRHTTRLWRLADHVTGTAIKSFRAAESAKSKLPHDFWQ